MEKLSFNKWYEINEDAINIKFAETGLDRELDFNCEVEFDLEYELYLNSDSDE